MPISAQVFQKMVKRPVAPVYENGEKTVTLKGDLTADEFEALIIKYIESTYPKR